MTDLNEVMGTLIAATTKPTSNPAGAIAQISRHVIDHSDGSCACGDIFTDPLEHLADITRTILGIAPEPAIIRRAENATRQRTLATTRMDANLARTRRLLHDLQARQERLAAALAETGLTSVADQLDWLIAHRTPDEQLAAERRWEARIREAVHLLEARRFDPNYSITQPEEAAA